MTARPLTPEPRGIAYWPDIARRHPGLNFVVYHRNSERSQAGPGKRKLFMNAHAIARQASQDADGIEPFGVFAGVERGQMSRPRPVFDEAVEAARRHKAVLVVADLSRLIRSEAYHRRLNPDALPTAAEFLLLFERALGVVLAVLLPIDATESQRLSQATKRTGKAGRPRACDLPTLLALVDCFVGPDGKRTGVSYRVAAERCGLPKTVVTRLMQATVRYTDQSGEPVERPLKDALNDFGDLAPKEIPSLLLQLLS